MTELTEVHGGVTAPAGFLAGALHCGIKKTGDPDLAIIFSEKPATVAGVFTTNLVKAAPVLHSQKVVEGGMARAVVANSGCANAVTGEQGKLDAETMARTAAACFGISPNEVAVASTGTIGQRLPIDRIASAIKKLAPAVNRHGGEHAARAIMTTDTLPKSVAARVSLSRGEIVIGGIAKGAGMICPDLATMLVFIMTDASVETPLLSRALNAAVQPSFNSITVDGDSSTNDTVLLMANGASGAAPINQLSEDYFAFQSGLQHICMRLAEMLVRDGEGATKLVRIHVVGAAEKADAQKTGKAIANSQLVKTAIFGADANWGRIMAAAGRAGVKINPDMMDIYLSDMPMLKAGTPQNFDEGRAKKLLTQKEVDITVNLHLGNESATILTCDLSYGYVKINASYRT